MNAPDKDVSHHNLSWGRALQTVSCWLGAVGVIAFPLLLLQAYILLKYQRSVPSFSIAEFIQMEFFILVLILSMVLGFGHRSWKVGVLMIVAGSGCTLILGMLLATWGSPAVPF